MYNNPYYYRNQMINRNNDRFIGGGFLAPFLLGGITGGLVAPYFYNPRVNYYCCPRPYPPYQQYNQNYYYY